MYPAMIEDARAEDNKAALRSFDYANAVEKVHAELYEKVLDNLEKRLHYKPRSCALGGLKQ